MRYFLIFVFCLCGFTSKLTAQIQILGFGEDEIKLNIYTDPSIPFYAIKDIYHTNPQGQLEFTPGDGNHWIFEWQIDGIPQPVFYTGDSTSLIVNFSRSGIYEFRASKEGRQVSEKLILFYVSVPSFTVSIPSEYAEDCYALKVKVDNFQPIKYKNTYAGSHPVRYFLGRAPEGGHLVYPETPVQMENYPSVDMEILDEVRSREDREKNAGYRVKIIDRFGLEWESENTVFYTSVFPKAKAEIELLNTVDIVGEVNEPMGQAPLEVYFHNQSVNADAYEWLLYKDTLDMTIAGLEIADSLLEGQIRTQPEFTYLYENTGRYKVRLIAIHNSENRCRDTSASLYVNVIESLVDVPNVFTPNGDGKNDIFMVRALSVKDFHGVILNRWGRKVYEWSDPLGGWDGRINGKYAAPGTYYYIITAKGREKMSTPKYVKKGAFMLIR